MGYRELLLTLGAMVVFGMTVISVNENVVNSTEAIYDQQVEYLAMMMAQKIIEEAKRKAFDENTINKESSVTVSTFSPSGSLGPGGGESYPYDFDDVDDYNGLAVTDSSAGIKMTIEVKVDYVAFPNLMTPVGSKQFYKLMVVTVKSPYLQKPIEAAHVFAYQKNG